MQNQPEILSVQQKLAMGGLQVLSASGELFNHVDQGLPMWAGHGDRKVTVDVIFVAAFGAPPLVSLGLTGIDNAHDQNLRLWLTPRNVTEKGFTIECSTWDDTHIARVAVSWQAIGPAVQPQPTREVPPVLPKKAPEPKP